MFRARSGRGSARLRTLVRHHVSRGREADRDPVEHERLVQPPADALDKVERMVGFHRQWGDDLSRTLNGKPLPPLGTRKIGEKIRLGFLSSDLRAHSVAKFVLPMFRAIDKSRFELFCYTPYEEKEDSVQKEFKEIADSFQVMQGWSDYQVAEKIRDDQVDVLFEMNGFTLNSRMPAMTLKPAPIQIAAHYRRSHERTSETD